MVAYLLLIVIACLFEGCQSNREEANLLLNENEICFNEKLISIVKKGENYYIGTESSGRIYVYSPEKNNLIDTLYTDCGRIYEIEQISEDNFYVGTQNMGLKKMHKEGNRLDEKISYIINGKGDRYSCYDILIDDDNIYAMTSHGIYQVVQSDTLKPVYYNCIKDVPEPFVTSNMVKSNGVLFAATAKGLVKIINNDTATIVKKNIKNVESHDGYVYALSDVLYKINSKGKCVDSFMLKASADFYYHTDSINYFLSGNQLTLVHDTTLLSISKINKQPNLRKKLDHYKTVNTRRRLSVEGHHVIVDSKNYSLLVADNALWKVGHHLPSVFGELKEGGAKLACKSDDNVYFLVGKKIYQLGHNNTAKEILELEEGGDISHMECSLNGEYLYYVKNKNEVWRQRFDSSWLQFGLETPEKIGTTEKEITAMCFHKSLGDNVILGIRDGLIYMDREGKDVVIKLFVGNNEVDSIPYIRRFAYGEDGYFVPTMNEGLFYGKGKELHIVDSTANLQFIRDVAYSEQDSLAYLLTNRHILIENGKILSDNDNYGSRIILSGNELYISGEVGGVRVKDISKGTVQQNDTILFSDIVFRPESSLEFNGIVYLGGQSGVIALSPHDEKGNYPYCYIKFEDKKVISRQSLLYIIASVVIVLLIFIVLLIKERRNHKKKEELKSRLSDLITEYTKLANKNKSKTEDFDVNKADNNLLASKIEHYIKLIGIEKTMERYRVLFTKYKDNRDKKIITFKYAFIEQLRTKHMIKHGVKYETEGISKIFSEDVRTILNKKENYTSEMKLEELNGIIIEHQDELVNDIREHINEIIKKLEGMSQNGEDTELILRILNVFRRMKTSVDNFSGTSAYKIFNLIEEVTINDGRLEMYNIMVELRKELSEYDGNNENISQLIEKFYAPIRYYHVDMEIIKQLGLIKSNLKEAPQKITESGAIQGPFVFLAIAMAKKRIPSKNNVEKYLQQSDKTKNRAYDCVEEWLNSDFVKGLNMRIHDDNDSLYSSAFASYLFEALPSKKTTALSQHGKQN